MLKKKKRRLLFGKKCTIGDICVWVKVAGGGSDIVETQNSHRSTMNRISVWNGKAPEETWLKLQHKPRRGYKEKRNRLSNISIRITMCSRKKKKSAHAP